MATLAPKIDATGCVIPSYEDLFAQAQNAYWSIFGSDANLDPDSQDGQMLAIFAQAWNVTNMAILATYNSYSPSTAQGAALSSEVKINGLARRVASKSSVVLTLVGQAGTVINAGQVGDDLSLGTRWLLPDTVTIPIGGSIDVTATCAVDGDVAAAPGSLTMILTPTRGWQSSTNAASASPGLPVETDAELRVRQSVSTSLPALTPLEAIYAAIANLPGVGRLQVYENDTDTTDGDGIPPHSISAVVEAGDVQQIAGAIAAKKSPGTGTYGSTTEIVIDAHGVPNTIRFYELDVIPLAVQITIQPLQGYVSTTGDLLKQGVVNFINALAIGEDSYLSRLYSPANLGGVGLGATFVVTSIEQSRDGDPVDPSDVTIAFNEAASAILADVDLITL